MLHQSLFCTVTRHQDQGPLQKKEWTWVYSSGGMRAWQRRAATSGRHSSRNRMLSAPMLSKHAAGKWSRKYCEAVKTHSPPPVTCYVLQGSASQESHNHPNSATSWGPRVQTPQTMGDGSHSNHHTCSSCFFWSPIHFYTLSSFGSPEYSICSWTQSYK